LLIFYLQCIFGGEYAALLCWCSPEKKGLIWVLAGLDPSNQTVGSFLRTIGWINDNLFRSVFSSQKMFGGLQHQEVGRSMLTNFVVQFSLFRRLTFK
jgi:hypothetical protein